MLYVGPAAIHPGLATSSCALLRAAQAVTRGKIAVSAGCPDMRLRHHPGDCLGLLAPPRLRGSSRTYPTPKLRRRRCTSRRAGTEEVRMLPKHNTGNLLAERVRTLNLYS